MDDGTEYLERAKQVALEANAERVEPIRLALRDVSEKRAAQWRSYTLGLRVSPPAPGPPPPGVGISEKGNPVPSYPLRPSPVIQSQGCLACGIVLGVTTIVALAFVIWLAFA